MGCFPGCFGTPGKERRRKTNRRPPPRRRVCEVCLKAKANPIPTATSNPVAEKLVEQPDAAGGAPGLRNETKLLDFTKTNKKKVKFDLNVTTYEAAPVFGEETDLSLDTDKLTDQVKVEEELQETEGNLEGSKLEAYLLSYRYQHCIQSDDEISEGDEDEHDEELEDSDLDLGDDFYPFVGKDQDEEESYDSYFSLKTEKMWPDLKESGSSTSSTVLANQTARCRSQYVHSVLNPVENLSQWKEVKKRHIPSKNSDKENIHLVEEKTLIHNSEQSNKFQKSRDNSTPIATKDDAVVDASLSVWLAPQEIPCVKGSAGFVSKSQLGLDAGHNSALKVSVTAAPDERPVVGTIGGYLKHSGLITIY